jgi:hypothetical protein
MNKALQILSATIILVALGLSFYLIYLLSFPLTPLVLNGPFKVVTPVVKQGEALIYKVNYCKAKGIGAGHVARTLVDGILYNLPEAYGTLQEGCRIVNITVEIPKVIPPGVYYLRILSTYEINKLRTVKIESSTERFTVIK